LKRKLLISRGIGDFSIYPARARLFSGKNPAQRFNPANFFNPERLF